MTYRHPRHKLICFCFPLLLKGGCDDADERPDDKKALPVGVAAGARRAGSGRIHSTSQQPECPVVVHSRAGARVVSDSLREISGIAASRESPGLFWVHNDSGNPSRVYAIDTKGQIAGSVELPVPALDWEDIALEEREDAPDRIYIADTGDNLSKRKDGVFLHRFSEPTRKALSGAAPGTLPVNAVETMHLHFPDGPRDAEALLVDADSGSFVLITKPHMAPPEVFEVAAFSAEATLTRQGSITPESSGHDFRLVTAADSSADGRWVILRSYAGVLLFPRAPGQRISDALLGKGCPLLPAYENQGEAIAFSPATEPLGQASSRPNSAFPGFVTIGEGHAQPLYFHEMVATRKASEGSVSAHP